MDIVIMAEEERYNNRQIERMLDEQSKDIKEHISSALDPILEQTTKTSGRLLKVEDQINSHRSWRTGMTWGGAIVFFFLTTFILPVLTWNILQTLEFKESLTEEIQSAVDRSFEDRINALETAP